MMKQEFEELAKINVTWETYSKIIEPMYIAADLPKQEFIKLLNLNALAAPKVKEKCIKKMCVRDRSGYMKTPKQMQFLLLFNMARLKLHSNLISHVSRNTRKGVVPEVTARCPMMAGQGNQRKQETQGKPIGLHASDMAVRL